MNNRAAFIDFCQGLLNMNPRERWTPQQARQHPFITGEKWTKPWTVSLTAFVGGPLYTSASLSYPSDPIIAGKCSTYTATCDNCKRG